MSDVGWSDRVRFAEDDGRFAYRPGEIIVAGQQGIDAVNRRFGDGFLAPEPVFDDERDSDKGDASRPLSATTPFFRMVGDIDPIDLVRDLRDEGVIAQPNHVLFAHCDCCCGPHPASLYGSPVYASPVYASPVYASPVYASPVYASPVYAAPVYASPVYASPYQATGVRKSSARPSGPPAALAMSVTAQPTGNAPRVLVLDTGFAEENLRPAALASVRATPLDRDRPDEDSDRYLDPAAGHGTFIAGVIEQLAPGCVITVEKVLTTYGDGDEVAIARRIRAAAGTVDILNLSFGGYAMEQLRVLGAAVRYVQAAGTVVVSSAGNDGTCRPTYPAALPGVIGVGAIGPKGPAPFSNYGPWVRACAPGVEIVSAFFREFRGAGQAPTGGIDPDDFENWAMWSGTSFSAPAVVGALAREMRAFDITAAQAVARVIDDPHLLRIPGLGTVVNIA